MTLEQHRADDERMREEIATLLGETLFVEAGAGTGKTRALVDRYVALVLAGRSVDRIIAIGSDRMMAAVKAARHGVLEPHLKKEHVGIGSINSPMQCMMKEVCAQCLQRHVDPATGREEFIFSCYNQDQDLDRVDFANLHARLRQNSVQEKISNLWFEHMLHEAEPELTHV